MKKIRITAVFAVSLALVLPLVVSCDSSSVKRTEDTVPEVADTIAVDTPEVKTEVKKEEPKRVSPKKDVPVKTEQPKQDAPKAEEIPQEIGASPDAVLFLDDNETESTPKFPSGEKELKKILKKALRKAKKGEKAKFRASIVVKSDGSVGRVQFTECGYVDEYKPEIIAVLKSLPPFTPGTKDGKSVDSWYYLNYKR